MPYVFGYGSLVDRASLQATLDRSIEPSDGPYPARLSGFRRRWNVAVDSGTLPDYAFTSAEGRAWQGWIIFLGIDRSAAHRTLGALYRLEAEDFAVLDIRERSYDRIDVTRQVDHLILLPAGERVFTYVPKDRVRERAETIGSGGTIMARYLRLVDRAYRSLGAELYAEHLRSYPGHDPFLVAEISAAPTDARARNEAVDPRS